MDHLNLIFYIKLLEPRIEDGIIDLPDICRFSSLANIHDVNILFERFKKEVLPVLYRYSPDYFPQFCIRKPDNFYKLIDHINRIDLESEEQDFLGLIYEYIIGRGALPMSTLVELVQLIKEEIPSMIDPLCGAGGLSHST